MAEIEGGPGDEFAGLRGDDKVCNCAQCDRLIVVGPVPVRRLAGRPYCDGCFNHTGRPMGVGEWRLDRRRAGVDRVNEPSPWQENAVRDLEGQ